jgi:hypothetical protein
LQEEEVTEVTVTGNWGLCKVYGFHTDCGSLRCDVIILCIVPDVLKALHLFEMQGTAFSPTAQKTANSKLGCNFNLTICFN